MTIPDATRAVPAPEDQIRLQQSDFVAPIAYVRTQLLRTAQVAELLGVTQGVVTRMARSGMLPAVSTVGPVRPTGRWRFRRADVDALLAEWRPPEQPGARTTGRPQHRRYGPPGPPPRPRPAVTLTPHTDRYIRGRLARGEIGARTAIDFRTRLDALARSFGVRPLVELDRHAIEAWQEETFGPLSPAARRGYLSTVKTFCRWLVAEGLLPADPTAGVSRVRQPRRIPRALPLAACQTLIATAGDDLRARAILLLMLQCGLRCVEVANLDVADYDRAAGTIRVTGKFDNERVLPVPDEVADAITAYLAAGGWSTGPLIRSKAGDNGIDARTISIMVSRLMAAAGLKRGSYDGVSAHACRHTAASDVLESSHDIRAVQGLLGHVHLSSTEIYLRATSLDQLRTAMAGRRYER
jgi:excisionase family DNA binding protein